MILRKFLSLRFLTKGVFDKHVLVIFQQCFFFFLVFVKHNFFLINKILCL